MAGSRVFRWTLCALVLGVVSVSGAAVGATITHRYTVHLNDNVSVPDLGLQCSELRVGPTGHLQRTFECFKTSPTYSGPAVEITPTRILVVASVGQGRTLFSVRR